MFPFAITVGLASCLCCGGSQRTSKPTPAAEVAPGLPRGSQQKPLTKPMRDALNLVALKRGAEAIERLGPESEAAERLRKMEVEMATGSSLRDALHAVYGDNWSSSAFPREVHAQLVAHDARYLSRMRKLVQSPLQSIWPSGRESVGEQTFRAQLMGLLPKSLRPAEGAPGGYRILHQIELGDGEPLRLGKTKSQMKSFELVQTLELWSLDDQLLFRTTVTGRLLGISAQSALSSDLRMKRASEQVVSRLLAQFLAEAELGRFQIDGIERF